MSEPFSLVSFIAGVIIAIIPIAPYYFKKGIDWWRFHEIKSVYSKLATEIILGNIEANTFKKNQNFILEIVKMTDWNQIKRILEETIHLHSGGEGSPQREKFYKCIGKELTQKYRKNWEEGKRHLV